MTKIIPISTIVFAFFAIVAGVYLIQKNTPQRSDSTVRSEPPLRPVASMQVEDSKAPDKKLAGYLGGIGIIEPAGEAVTIGSELSGVVQQLFVAPGDFIERGMPLFALDDRVAKANVGVAQAKLLAEEARLAELRGQIATQRARVDGAVAAVTQADATLANARLSYERSEKLFQTNAMASEEFEEKRLNLLLAEGKLVEAKAKQLEASSSLDLLDGKDSAPTIDVQKAIVEQARASLVLAQTTLDQHVITAPKSGSILQVKIRVGEFVQAAILSSPVITLGVIDPLHVRVDIDETEIHRFRSSSNAVASLRGSSSQRIPLTYVRSEPYVTPKKSLTGGTSERVDTRVLQIIYSIDPSTIQAFPGQQVDVYIEVQE
jgi:multidrug resistance efflux pump